MKIMLSALCSVFYFNPQARAVIFSGLTVDFSGYKTNFSFNGSRCPFDFDIISLSPTGLIQAIIENRLEIDGMIVSGNIYKAYDFLWENGYCDYEI